MRPLRRGGWAGKSLGTMLSRAGDRLRDALVVAAQAGDGMAVLLLHGHASGQGAELGGPLSPGLYAIPSFSVAEEFRSNVFGTARSPTSDFVTTFTPGLSLGYRSEPFTLLGSYALTSEVYADNPDLDSAVARQVASLGLRYSPDRRLSLRLDGTYTDTNNAGQFLLPFTPALGTPAPGAPSAGATAPATGGAGTTSGGTAGGIGAPITPAPGTPGGPSVIPAVSTQRIHASVISASTGASYALNVQTTLDANYTYTRVRESGTPDNAEHQGTLSASRVFTPQDTGRLTYKLAVFEGNSQQRGLTTNSGLIGWTHQFTPLLTASADIGPRFDSDGGVGLDASASLEYRFLEQASAALAYTHGEGLVVGRQGASIVDTVTASVSYVPLRDLVLSLVGSFSRTDSLGSSNTGTTTGGVATGSTGEGVISAPGASGTATPAVTTSNTGSTVETVYAIGLTASYRLTQTLSLRGYYQFSHNESSGPSGAPAVDNHVVGVALDWSYPFRIQWFE